MKQLKSHKTFDGKTEFWSHQSESTKTEMKFSTFIPNTEVTGCLIWLSGLTCNEENFITKAGAQKFLAENKMMLIAPDTSPRGLKLPGEDDSYDFGTGASFYLNATKAPYDKNYQMETYICDELYELIKREFKVSKISLSGHSMGGHGALVLGLRHPQKFSAISAFSPIVNPSVVPWGQKAFAGYLGEDKNNWKEFDATELLKSGKKHSKKILIHQGTKDEFLEKELLTENFVKASKEAGQEQEVKYAEGYDHSYYFISTFIEEHIRHHKVNL